MVSNYLSIKEFAKAVNVSEQAVYKRINKGLKPYCQTINGKKMISKEALSLYKEPTSQPTLQPTFNNQVESVDNSSVSTSSTQPNPSTSQPTIKPTSSSVEAAEIQTLNKMVDLIERELEVKNKQIEELNARLSEALGTIEKQNILISQQQHLSLLDKTENLNESAATSYNEEAVSVDTDFEEEPQVINNKEPEEKKGLFKKLFG